MPVAVPAALLAAARGSWPLLLFATAEGGAAEEGAVERRRPVAETTGVLTGILAKSPKPKVPDSKRCNPDASWAFSARALSLALVPTPGTVLTSFSRATAKNEPSTLVYPTVPMSA